MKVILLVSVLTIACVSYGQGVHRGVSEAMKKEEEEISEDKNIGNKSLQKEEPLKKNFDLWKLQNNNAHIVKLHSDFVEQVQTKLGIIVVPDLPEEEKDLEYQSQNIVEIKQNVATLAGLIVENGNNKITKEEILTTVANLEEETETSMFESQSEEKYNKSHKNELKDNLETTTELPTTFKFERKLSSKINKPVGVSYTAVDKINLISRKTFPRLDFEIVKPVYNTDDQDNQANRFSTNEPRLKKFERKTFNSWDLLDFEEGKHGNIVKITKEVPYPAPYPVEKNLPFPVKVEFDRPISIEVPKPYPVTFENNIYFPIRKYVHAPYPVFRKLPYFIQISVHNPIPFHIPRPYPVYIEKKVPYPVEKQIPIPINIPVNRPKLVHFPFVKNVYYPIEKKMHYPVPISVEKPIPLSVEKPYPVYIEKQVPTPVKEHFSYQINVEDSKTKCDIRTNYNLQNKDDATESFPDHKTEHIRSHGSLGFEVNNNNGFVPLGHTTTTHDHKSLQKKKR